MEADRGCCEEVRRGTEEFQVENCVRARRTADPSAPLGMTRGELLLTLYSASRMAHYRSLGFARDDKGRVVTHLKTCESDREFCVIPSVAEGPAVSFATCTPKP